MSTRERRLARATWLMQSDAREAGDELRQARLRRGQTLRAVATALGCSPSSVLRTERGIGPGQRPDQLARHAAAVGLRARIKLYPDDSPLRDAGQIQLIRAFRTRLGGSIGFSLESPVVTVQGGDMRAFDALLTIGSCRCGVEFYTRFHDCQAQVRSALLKQRDARVDRLFIVLKATHANRRAVSGAADLIATTFPLGTRAVLAALSGGRDPGANGLVFL